MEQIGIFEYQKRELDEIGKALFSHTGFPYTYADIVGHLIRCFEVNELKTEGVEDGRI